MVIVDVSGTGEISVSGTGSCNAILEFTGTPVSSVFTPCRAVEITNIPDFNNAPATVDGVTLGVGDRVIVLGQTSTVENGIYVVQSLAPTVLVRAPDLAVSATIPDGNIVQSVDGDVYAYAAFYLRTDDADPRVQNGTVGTDGIVFPGISPLSGPGVDVDPLQRSLTLGPTLYLDKTDTDPQSMLSTFNVQNTTDVDLVNRSGGALIVLGGLNVDLNTQVSQNLQVDTTLILPALISDQILFLSGDTVTGSNDLVWTGSLTVPTLSVTGLNAGTLNVPSVGTDEIWISSAGTVGGNANLTFTGTVLSVPATVVTNLSVSGTLSIGNVNPTEVLLATNASGDLGGSSGFTFTPGVLTVTTPIEMGIRLEFGEGLPQPPTVFPASVSTGLQVQFESPTLVNGETFPGYGRETSGSPWISLKNESSLLRLYSGDTSTLTLTELARIGRDTVSVVFSAEGGTVFVDQVRPLTTSVSVSRNASQFFSMDPSGVTVTGSPMFVSSGTSLISVGSTIEFQAPAAGPNTGYSFITPFFILNNLNSGTFAGDNLEYDVPTGRVFVNTSTRANKTNIRPIETLFPTEIVYDLEPVAFEYNEQTLCEDETSFGFIAEDVFDVHPELTNRDADGRPIGVRYNQLYAALVNEFAKLRAEIDSELYEKTH